MFVLKSHSQIIKKGEKKVNALLGFEPEISDLQEVEKKKKKKKYVLPGLEAGTSDLGGQYSNSYTTKTSHPNVFKICPLYTNSVLYSWRLALA